MITIIIPTHNRKEVLKRAIEYYKIFKNFEIIVCDSSEIAEDNFEKIKYIHLPNMGFANKIKIALENANNKYVCLSPDDDFLIENNLLIGYEFLEKNLKYSTVHGIYFQFEKNENNFVNFNTIYSHNNSLNVINPDPLKRVEKLINPFMQLLYSLHRIENIKSFVTVASKSKELTNLEISANLIVPILGFHKTLPILWMLRDKHRYTTYNITKNNLNTVVSNYNEYLMTENGIFFKTIITNFYKDNFYKSNKTVLVDFDNLFKSYLDYEIENATPKIIKNKFKRYINNRFVTFKESILVNKMILKNFRFIKYFKKFIIKFNNLIIVEDNRI